MDAKILLIAFLSVALIFSDEVNGQRNDRRNRVSCNYVHLKRVTLILTAYSCKSEASDKDSTERPEILSKLVNRQKGGLAVFIHNNCLGYLPAYLDCQNAAVVA